MDKNNPTAYILWGPPGAGKSTLTNFFGGDTIFKNTDDIVKFVCNNPNEQKEYWECRKNEKVKYIDEYLNHLSATQGKNIAIETTGGWYGKYKSSRGKLKNHEVTWAQELKENFSKVVVLVVYVNDVDILWERIQNRDQLSVTKKQLEETYNNSYNKNMLTLINDEFVDDILVYD